MDGGSLEALKDLYYFQLEAFAPSVKQRLWCINQKN